MGEPRALTRADLLRRGLSTFEVERDLMNGDLVRLAHGIYLRRSEYDALGDIGRHRVMARHVASTLPPEAALSHVSAAVLHGAAVWSIPLDRIHLCHPGAESRRTGKVHVHGAHLGSDEIVDVDGTAVTAVHRTIIDLACTLPTEQSVATGDALLRAHPSASALLTESVRRLHRQHGAHRARFVVGFLDGRSESVGESLSRLRISEFGLPKPALQHEVVTRDGRRFRLDFFWEEEGVVGEFDGMAKYADRRDLISEKLREDELRDLGLEVIRWNWAELERFDMVVDRFRRACNRRICRLV